MKVIQIVPGLAPRHEGVGGYAEALAVELAAKHSVTTEWVAPVDAHGLAEALARAGTDSVLLHYSGYGFATRGCPSWLLGALENWRARSPRRRLVTMFHEVYASSAEPWRSSFWLSPLQRLIARRLVGISDVLLTSLDLYMSLLAPWARGKSIRVAPVFSTVGELREPPQLAARQRRLIVFGGADRRRAAYEADASLRASCIALDVEEILDVGPQISVPETIGSIPVRRCGALAQAEVSALLRDSVVGFLAYPAAFLPKSTIFAAYCAHGMLPVCSAGSGPGAPGIREGEHYLRTGSRPDDGQKKMWQSVARSAHGWYTGHSLGPQAEALRVDLA